MAEVSGVWVVVYGIHGPRLGSIPGAEIKMGKRIWTHTWFGSLGPLGI